MSKEKTSGIYFKTSDKDMELIAQKMEQANVRNRSAYIRKMCIDGYVLRLELPELTTCAKYLRSASNNLNQIARRIHSGGGEWITSYECGPAIADQDFLFSKQQYAALMAENKKLYPDFKQ